MSTYYIQKSLPNRIISAFLAITFAFSIQQSPAISQTIDLPRAESAKLNLQKISELAIPEKLGRVESNFDESSNQKIVVIQDAHSIPDAQRNIHKLIEYLDSQYGIHAVGLEGAADKLDPQFFKSFPEPKKLKEVLEHYFDKGELAGGTAAAIYSKHPEKFHGVEDWPLYEESISLYLEAMQKETGLNEKLEKWNEELKGKKEQIYTADLLELDAVLEKFWENEGDLTALLKTLAKIKAPVKDSELDLILAEAKRNENTGTSDADIEIEVKKMAERVKGYCDSFVPNAAQRVEINKFSQEYQQFKVSQITPQAFALSMRESVRKITGGKIPKELKVKMSARLASMLGKQKRLRDIEGTKFFDDLKAYIREVQSGQIENDGQKQLLEESNQYELIKKLVKLELTREEWDEVKKMEDGGWKVDGKTEKTYLQSSSLDLRPYLAFYKNAEQRDEVLMTNLLKLTGKEVEGGGWKVEGMGSAVDRRPSTVNLSVIVAGGFHAQGLADHLKEKGISYALILPRINVVPQESNYRAQMKGEVSWKDYFEDEGGKVSLYKAFARGTRDELLQVEGVRSRGEGKSNSFNLRASSLQLAKRWRDKIIRDLADKKQIEKSGEYTKFIDELNPANKNQDDLKKRIANVEAFLSGVRRLTAEGKLSEQNIFNLLRPAATPAQTSAPGVLGSDLAASTLVRGQPRFESRAEPKIIQPSEKLTAVRSESRAKSGLGQILEKFPNQIRIPKNDPRISNVPEDILKVFSVNQREGNPDVRILTGGTARDFSIAVTHGNGALTLPHSTDVDVAVLFPGDPISQGWYEEGYNRIQSDFENIIDFIPGMYGVGDIAEYTFEHQLKLVNKGNAFGVSRLAVVEDGDEYVILGSSQAIKELNEKDLNIWLAEGKSIGIEMAAKMLGKASIYHEYANFRFKEGSRSRQLIENELESIKAQDKRLINFAEDLWRHSELVGDDVAAHKARIENLNQHFNILTPLGLEDIQQLWDAIPALNSRAESRTVKRAIEEKKEEDEERKPLKPISSLMLYEADYGFLPQKNAIYRFVHSRLRQLMPDVPEQDLPRVEILARRGQGINAMAFENGTILVSPELIEFIEQSEELDFVLLHEINHILQSHHSEYAESLKQEKWESSLGLLRMHEYEADILAFYQMGDAKRKSNPLGAIRFLERLLTTSDDSWDIAHGSLNDRILNLKSLLGYLDLLDLSDVDQLSSVDTKIKDEIKKFQKGGRLTKLLEKPPLFAREWEKWIQEVQGILEKADFTLLNQALGRFYKDYQEAKRTLTNGPASLSRTAKEALTNKIDTNQRLIQFALTKWNAQFKARHPDLSLQDQVFQKVVLLEVQAGFPLMSAPDFPQNFLIFTLDGEHDTLKTLQKQYQKKMEKKDFMETFTEAASIPDSAFMGGRFYDFAVYTALAQLGDFMAFDEEEKGIDLDSYLRVSFKMLDRVSQSEEKHGTQDDLANDSADQLKKARVEFIVRTILLLADLDALDENAGARLNKYKSMIPDSENLYAHKILKELDKKFPKAAKAARKFLESNGFIKTFPEFSEQSRKMTELYQGLNKLIVNGQFQFDPDKAEHKNLFKEIANLVRELPDQFPETLVLGKWQIKDSFGFGNALIELLDPTKVKYPTKEARLGYVHFFQLMESDSNSFARQVLDLFSGNINRMGIYEMTEVIKAAEDLSGVTTRYGMASRLKSVKNIWSRTSDAAISGLSRTGVGNIPESYLKDLEWFVMHWPMDGLVTLASSKVGNYSEMQEILSRALALLSKTEMTAREKDYYYLVTSFFIPDVAARSTIQAYFLQKIVKASTFEEASELLFEKFKTQGALGGKQSLEILIEQISQTPEQLEMLKQRVKDQFGKRDLMSGYAANLLLPDFVAKHLLKGDGKMNLVRQFLKSSKDDKELRGWLAGLWASFYMSVFSDELVAPESFMIESIKKSEEVHELGGAQYIFPKSILERFYQLDEQGRYLLLRLLLTGKGGVVNNPTSRKLLADEFLSEYLTAGGNKEMTRLLTEVISSLFEAAPADELYLVLNPLLLSRIANPPQTPGDWSVQAKEILKKYPPLSNPTAQEKKRAKERLFYLLSGQSPNASPVISVIEEFYKVVPPDFITRDNRQLNPIEMIMEIASQLGAPGVRFLQLLGQTFEISVEYRTQFNQVYDSMKGQSKISAWETIKRYAPGYASQIKRMIRRVGGGSLFTVYQVELKDGTLEVVRVMNPNALYHAQSFIKVIRDGLKNLSETDPKYTKALPLIDMIEKWITQELLDPTFEKDDAIFREKWNGWTLPGYSTKVVVPESRPTGTNKVRPENYVQGYHEAQKIDAEDNLTNLESFAPEKQKELVSLAVHHYFSQIMEEIPGTGTSYVHSDISGGNLRVNQDGDLAILDRGMPLKFDEKDRDLLGTFMGAQNPEAKTDVLLNWIWNLEENTKITKKISKQIVRSKLLEKAASSKSLDEMALDLLVVVQNEGLKIPLKYNLLFKNINALRQLALRAGFDSKNPIMGALMYAPQVRSESRSLSTFAKAAIVSASVTLAGLTFVGLRHGDVPSDFKSAPTPVIVKEEQAQLNTPLSQQEKVQMIAKARQELQRIANQSNSPILRAVIDLAKNYPVLPSDEKASNWKSDVEQIFMGEDVFDRISFANVSFREKLDVVVASLAHESVHAALHAVRQKSASGALLSDEERLLRAIPAGGAEEVFALEVGHFVPGKVILIMAQNAEGKTIVFEGRANKQGNYTALTFAEMKNIAGQNKPEIIELTPDQQIEFLETVLPWMHLEPVKEALEKIIDSLDEQLSPESELRGPSTDQSTGAARSESRSQEVIDAAKIILAKIQTRQNDFKEIYKKEYLPEVTKISWKDDQHTTLMIYLDSGQYFSTGVPEKFDSDQRDLIIQMLQDRFSLGIRREVIDEIEINNLFELEMNLNQWAKDPDYRPLARLEILVGGKSIEPFAEKNEIAADIQDIGDFAHQRIEAMARFNLNIENRPILRLVKLDYDSGPLKYKVEIDFPEPDTLGGKRSESRQLSVNPYYELQGGVTELLLDSSAEQPGSISIGLEDKSYLRIMKDEADKPFAIQLMNDNIRSKKPLEIADGAEFVFGRSSEMADLSINSEGAISRFHARISFSVVKESGKELIKVRIEDLFSRNGTFIRAENLAKAVPYEVPFGFAQRLTPNELEGKPLLDARVVDSDILSDQSMSASLQNARKARGANDERIMQKAYELQFNNLHKRFESLESRKRSIYSKARNEDERNKLRYLFMYGDVLFYKLQNTELNNPYNYLRGELAIHVIDATAHIVNQIERLAGESVELPVQAQLAENIILKPALAQSPSRLERLISEINRKTFDLGLMGYRLAMSKIPGESQKLLIETPAGRRSISLSEAQSGGLLRDLRQLDDLFTASGINGYINLLPGVLGLRVRGAFSDLLKWQVNAYMPPGNSVAGSSSRSESRTQNWFQFNLRTLLAGIAIGGIILGGYRALQEYRANKIVEEVKNEKIPAFQLTQELAKHEDTLGFAKNVVVRDALSNIKSTDPAKRLGGYDTLGRLVSGDGNFVPTEIETQELLNRLIDGLGDENEDVVNAILERLQVTLISYDKTISSETYLEQLIPNLKNIFSNKKFDSLTRLSAELVLSQIANSSSVNEAVRDAAEEALKEISAARSEVRTAESVSGQAEIVDDFLKVLKLDGWQSYKRTPAVDREGNLIDPNNRLQSVKIVVSSNDQRDKDPQTGFAQGLGILSAELGDTQNFEMLIYEGRIIAIIPEPGALKQEEDQRFHYFRLSDIQFDVPQPGEKGFKERWLAFSEQVKKDNELLEKYLNARGLSKISNRDSQARYSFITIRKETGFMAYQPFSAHDLKMTSKDYNDPQAGENVLDFISKQADSDYHLIVPAIPTVYPPGGGFTYDDAMYYLNLGRDLFRFYKNPPDDFQGTPQEWKNLKKSWNVGTVGPGTGVTTLLKWLATEADTVYVTGLNPFELTNTHWLFKIINRAWKKDVKVVSAVEDNIDWVLNRNQKGFPAQFDVLEWNMPAVEASGFGPKEFTDILLGHRAAGSLSLREGSFTDLHDGYVGAILALQRLATALPEVLRTKSDNPYARFFAWNIPRTIQPQIVKSGKIGDFVEATFNFGGNLRSPDILKVMAENQDQAADGNTYGYYIVQNPGTSEGRSEARNIEVAADEKSFLVYPKSKTTKAAKALAALQKRLDAKYGQDWNLGKGFEHLSRQYKQTAQLITTQLGISDEQEILFIFSRFYHDFITLQYFQELVKRVVSQNLKTPNELNEFLNQKPASVRRDSGYKAVLAQSLERSELLSKVMMGEKSVSDLPVWFLWDEIHADGGEEVFRQMLSQLAGETSEKRNSILNILDQLASTVTEIAQWDFLHRFPGASSMRILRGSPSAVGLADKKQTFDIKIPLFFTFLPNHAASFIGRNPDGGVFVVEIPVESLRHSIWIRGDQGYEAEVLVQGKAELKGLYHLKNEEGAFSVELFPGWHQFANDYHQKLMAPGVIEKFNPIDRRLIENFRNAQIKAFTHTLGLAMMKQIQSPQLEILIDPFPGLDGISRDISLFRDLVGLALEKTNDNFKLVADTLLGLIKNVQTAQIASRPGKNPYEESFKELLEGLRSRRAESRSEVYEAADEIVSEINRTLAKSGESRKVQFNKTGLEESDLRLFNNFLTELKEIRAEDIKIYTDVFNFSDWVLGAPLSGLFAWFTNISGDHLWMKLGVLWFFISAGLGVLRQIVNLFDGTTTRRIEANVTRQEKAIQNYTKEDAAGNLWMRRNAVREALIIFSASPRAESRTQQEEQGKEYAPSLPRMTYLFSAINYLKINDKLAAMGLGLVAIVTSIVTIGNVTNAVEGFLLLLTQGTRALNFGRQDDSDANLLTPVAQPQKVSRYYDWIGLFSSIISGRFSFGRSHYVNTIISDAKNFEGIAQDLIGSITDPKLADLFRQVLGQIKNDRVILISSDGALMEWNKDAMGNVLAFVKEMLLVLNEIPEGILDRGVQRIPLTVQSIKYMESNFGSVSSGKVSMTFKPGMMDEPLSIELKDGEVAVYSKDQMKQTLIHEVIGHYLAFSRNLEDPNDFALPMKTWAEIAALVLSESELKLFTPSMIKKNIEGRFNPDTVISLKEIRADLFRNVAEAIAYSVANDESENGLFYSKGKMKQIREILSRDLLIGNDGQHYEFNHDGNLNWRVVDNKKDGLGLRAEARTEINLFDENWIKTYNAKMGQFWQEHPQLRGFYLNNEGELTGIDGSREWQKINLMVMRSKDEEHQDLYAQGAVLIPFVETDEGKLPAIYEIRGGILTRLSLPEIEKQMGLVPVLDAAGKNLEIQSLVRTTGGGTARVATLPGPFSVYFDAAGKNIIKNVSELENLDPQLAESVRSRTSTSDYRARLIEELLESKKITAQSAAALEFKGVGSQFDSYRHARNEDPKALQEVNGKFVMIRGAVGGYREGFGLAGWEENLALERQKQIIENGGQLNDRLVSTYRVSEFQKSESDRVEREQNQISLRFTLGGTSFRLDELKRAVLLPILRERFADMANATDDELFQRYLFDLAFRLGRDVRAVKDAGMVMTAGGNGLDNYDLFGRIADAGTLNTNISSSPRYAEAVSDMLVQVVNQLYPRMLDDERKVLNEKLRETFNRAASLNFLVSTAVRAESRSEIKTGLDLLAMPLVQENLKRQIPFKDLEELLGIFRQLYRSKDGQYLTDAEKKFMRALLKEENAFERLRGGIQKQAQGSNKKFANLEDFQNFVQEVFKTNKNYEIRLGNGDFFANITMSVWELQKNAMAKNDNGSYLVKNHFRDIAFNLQKIAYLLIYQLIPDSAVVYRSVEKQFAGLPGVMRTQASDWGFGEDGFGHAMSYLVNNEEAERDNLIMIQTTLEDLRAHGIILPDFNAIQDNALTVIHSDPSKPIPHQVVPLEGPSADRAESRLQQGQRAESRTGDGFKITGNNSQRVQPITPIARMQNDLQNRNPLLTKGERDTDAQSPSELNLVEIVRKTFFEGLQNQGLIPKGEGVIDVDDQPDHPDILISPEAKLIAVLATFEDDSVPFIITSIVNERILSDAAAKLRQGDNPGILVFYRLDGNVSQEEFAMLQKARYLAGEINQGTVPLPTLNIPYMILLPPARSESRAESRAGSIDDVTLDRLVSMGTYGGRNMPIYEALLNHLEQSLGEEFQSSEIQIADVGVGVLPIGLGELGKIFKEKNPKTKLFGFDNQMPYAMVRTDTNRFFYVTTEGEILGEVTRGRVLNLKFAQEILIANDDREKIKNFVTQREGRGAQEGYGLTINPMNDYLRRFGISAGVDLADVTVESARAFDLGEKHIGQFDAMTVLNVLVHYDAQDQKRILRQLAEYLKEGGVIVVSYHDAVTVYKKVGGELAEGPIMNRISKDMEDGSYQFINSDAAQEAVLPQPVSYSAVDEMFSLAQARTESRLQQAPQTKISVDVVSRKIVDYFMQRGQSEPGTFEGKRFQVPSAVEAFARSLAPEVLSIIEEGKWQSAEQYIEAQLAQLQKKAEQVPANAGVQIDKDGAMNFIGAMLSGIASTGKLKGVTIGLNRPGAEDMLQQVLSDKNIQPLIELAYVSKQMRAIQVDGINSQSIDIGKVGMKPIFSANNSLIPILSDTDLAQRPYAALIQSKGNQDMSNEPFFNMVNQVVQILTAAVVFGSDEVSTKADLQIADKQKALKAMLLSRLFDAVGLKQDTVDALIAFDADGGIIIQSDKLFEIVTQFRAEQRVKAAA